MSSGIFRIGFRGFDLDHVKRFRLADQTIYRYVQLNMRSYAPVEPALKPCCYRELEAPLDPRLPFQLLAQLGKRNRIRAPLAIALYMTKAPPNYASIRQIAAAAAWVLVSSMGSGPKKDTRHYVERTGADC
jgi:hypothetical protein